MQSPTIWTATTSDENGVLALMNLAFSKDPVARWQYPDPYQYQLYFPQFVRAFGGKAFDHQCADCVEGFAGAALWLPPDVHPDEETLGELIESTVQEKEKGELLAVLEQTETYHPQEPHWFLPLIGVDALHQGKGYGAALLAHGLARCDRDRAPAYLDATNQRNVRLYQRFGFEVLGTIQVGTSPTFAAMLRMPQ